MWAKGFAKTSISGRSFEDDVAKLLRKYSRFVYQNVRIPSYYTKRGDTEIDILAAIGDVILVVELKNVKSIKGTVGEMMWTMQGYRQGDIYSTLNVFCQNRIHVRSLKNLWSRHHRSTPVIVPIVVTPNGCTVSSQLKEHGVLNLSQFDQQLISNFKQANSGGCGYSLAYICTKAGIHL